MTDGKEVVVGLGTLGMIVAGIAQSKNRSGFIWFWLGLFFGPLALFVLLLLNKLDDPHKKDK